MNQAIPGTVMIVDDDPAIRRLIETILEACGVPTAAAADLSGATQLLRQELGRVKACLLDLNLKECKGESVYDELKKIDPLLAVFPMSGLFADEIQERFSGRPISGIISKPFKASQLIDTIKRGLRDSEQT